jgi:hypothetical protein
MDSGTAQPLSPRGLAGILRILHDRDEAVKGTSPLPTGMLLGYT